jgi:TadE-like protein
VIRRRDHRRAGLVSDSSGAVIIEFAIVAPVFMLLIIGCLDLGQMAYAKSVLEGAVQKAARDSSLETASTLQADNMVKNMIGPVLPGSTITTTRTSYYDFVDVGRPERWNDANNNGTCDHNESFVDENSNGDWDEDIGVSGNGGASDVIVYTVNAKYNPVFRIPFMPATWAERTLSATAVRKNQPFSLQAAMGSNSGICS